MTEEITEAIRNAFNEYLNAVNKVILENQALQIELQHLKQDNTHLNDLLNQALKEQEELRIALEEIREIADKCKECLNEDDDCMCDYLRIKRRIDEVLE